MVWRVKKATLVLVLRRRDGFVTCGLIVAVQTGKTEATRQASHSPLIESAPVREDIVVEDGAGHVQVVEFLVVVIAVIERESGALNGGFQVLKPAGKPRIIAAKSKMDDFVLHRGNEVD
jgi:hypothetical protein